MGGVNKVTILCDLEANKCDAHPILVEEDVRMGTVDKKDEVQ